MTDLVTCATCSDFFPGKEALKAGCTCPLTANIDYGNGDAPMVVTYPDITAESKACGFYRANPRKVA